MEDKLSANQRSGLVKHGKNSGMKELIITSFEICGLSAALGGSENAQLSIDGIPNYEMPQRFVEEKLILLEGDNDEDEDTSENDESYQFDLLTDQEIPLAVE